MLMRETAADELSVMRHGLLICIGIHWRSKVIAAEAEVRRS
jgi:hypothetical protein